MKKFGFILLLACLTAPFLVFGGEEASVKGEVVDLSCYLKSGAKGEDHRQCAQRCVQGGLPMGLLTDSGEIYLLLENHGKKDAYASAKEFAADKVEIKGELAERNGMKAIVVNACAKI